MAKRKWTQTEIQAERTYQIAVGSLFAALVCSRMADKEAGITVASTQSIALKEALDVLGERSEDGSTTRVEAILTSDLQPLLEQKDC